MLHPNSEPPGAPELPGDVIAAHDAEDLATELAVDHRPPRDEAEAEPITMLPNRASSVVAVSRSVTWWTCPSMPSMVTAMRSTSRPWRMMLPSSRSCFRSAGARLIPLMISLRAPSTPQDRFGLLGSHNLRMALLPCARSTTRWRGSALAPAQPLLHKDEIVPLGRGAVGKHQEDVRPVIAEISVFGFVDDVEA
jgi:hypothetical protein